MPLHPEIKKSTANRRAQRGSGLTGLTVEFQLVHLQNLAILRDELLNWHANHPEDDETLKLVNKAYQVVDFIVQKDFESPIDSDLWGYDPQDRISASPKF